jgi:Lectin C-type domain
MWIAASDRGEEGAFKWCYPDRVDKFQFPPYLPFEEGEPSNSDDVENCLDIGRRDGNYYYNDTYCNLEQAYVCEVKKMSFLTKN